MLAAALSKPRWLTPSSGRNCLYVTPKPKPRFSVMRFDTSTEKSVSRVADASPLAGVLIVEIVGSDSSSATNGSSVVSVAGKNRFPEVPCAKAASAVATHANAAPTMYSDGFRLLMIFSPLVRSMRHDLVEKSLPPQRGKCQRPCAAPAPISSTQTDTSTAAAFWNLSVRGNLSPPLSGCLSSLSIT